MSDDTGTTATESDFPRGWRWDEDGKEVQGTFVKFDLGQTRDYGAQPIVVLNVNGEERSIWAFHTTLKSKFKNEVNRRDLEVGERVYIKQIGEKPGGQGRAYMNYVVTFPDAPPVTGKSIFGEEDEIDKGPVAYAEPVGDLPVSRDF